MRKTQINQYAGIIYEMQQEVNEGKDFVVARQETSTWLRKLGDKDGSRLFAFVGQAEFTNAYNSIKEEQAIYG